jgi:hypothetical protein
LGLGIAGGAVCDWEPVSNLFSAPSARSEAGAGDRAALRFLEYFTVNIRNKNTRAAYARAAPDFLGWCERAGD